MKMNDGRIARLDGPVKVNGLSKVNGLAQRNLTLSIHNVNFTCKTNGLSEADGYFEKT